MRCACVVPTMLEELQKRIQLVALRFCDHGTKEMLGVVGQKFNHSKQQATARKRTQHVISNNVGNNVSSVIYSDVSYLKILTCKPQKTSFGMPLCKSSWKAQHTFQLLQKTLVDNLKFLVHFYEALLCSLPLCCRRIAVKLGYHEGKFPSRQRSVLSGSRQGICYSGCFLNSPHFSGVPYCRYRRK